MRERFSQHARSPKETTCQRAATKLRPGEIVWAYEIEHAVGLYILDSSLRFLPRFGDVCIVRSGKTLRHCCSEVSCRMSVQARCGSCLFVPPPGMNIFQSKYIEQHLSLPAFRLSLSLRARGQWNGCLQTAGRVLYVGTSLCAGVWGRVVVFGDVPRG